jgi:hypothetical protein
MIDYLGPKPSINLYGMHVTPLEMRNCKSQHFLDLYYKFAIVRNTWDWHCSQFFFHKEATFSAFHGEFRDMAFSDYVDWAVRPENIARARALQKKFISDEFGTIMVDKILRFERLDIDFAETCQHVGVDVALPHVNKSNRISGYKANYSKNDMKKIADAFAEDIEFFNFKFE